MKQSGAHVVQREASMGSGVKRGIAAAGTVVVAAAVNVTTGMLTQHWAAAWWAATAVLLVVGSGLQWWLTIVEKPARPSRVSASGAGSIAAGESVRRATTNVAFPWSGSAGRSQPDPGDRVIASGPGAIAAGLDVEGSRTEVTGKGPAAP